MRCGVKSLRPASIWGQFAAFWTDLGPIRCVLACGGSWADFRAWAASRAGVRPSTFPALGPRSSITADAAFLRRAAPSTVTERAPRGAAPGAAPERAPEQLREPAMSHLSLRQPASKWRKVQNAAKRPQINAERSKTIPNQCRTQQIDAASMQNAHTLEYELIL